MKQKKIKMKNFLTTLLVALCLTTGIAIAHEWMAPERFGKTQNPVQMTAESIAKGKELFLDNCAVCHGDTGVGLSAKEAGLEKNTPNLKKRLSTHSDGDFFWKIQTGRGEMPGFKEDLNDQEIWDVINFIKSETSDQ